MAGGPPDLIDCAKLASAGTVLERSYEFGDLPRLKDLLADPQGLVRARFAFTTLGAERIGASIEVSGRPRLRCQRCLGGFELEVDAASDVEFAEDAALRAADGSRELYGIEGGRVSLRELAEEELLLALPIVPACAAPERCARAPALSDDAERGDGTDEQRRPFRGLKDLLKKT